VPSLFADSFTRANSSTLGTGWFEFNSGTPSVTWEIFTNQLRSPNAGSPANAHYACTTSAAHTATADAKTTCKRISGTSWDGGPLVRRQGDAGAGTNTFYYVDVTSATSAQIYREVAGTDTAVGAAITGTFADGDTYAIEASGTTLNFYNNGSLVASRTDSNISAAGLRRRGDVVGLGHLGRLRLLVPRGGGQSTDRDLYSRGHYGNVNE
jgi:hypothetical protein